MATSVPMRLLCVAASLLLVLPAALSAGIPRAVPPITNHGGRVLTNLNIGILWYGPIPRVQKKAILTFFRSLNSNARNVTAGHPAVSSWWKVVESYQRGSPRIPVKVVSQQSDPNYSLGKVLIKDFIKMLLPKATGGKPNTLALIIAPKGVTVQDMCSGSCAQHGFIGDTVYVPVGNPEMECPDCASPFLNPAAVRPPSGNVGADTMVKLLAGGLAGAVTNPFGDGFFATGPGGDPLDATNMCTAAAPVLHSGADGSLFFLPALWNPKTCSC